MRKFLLKILAFFGIPLLLLGIIYLVVDPFRTLRPFDLDYFDDTNRDYLSTELFLRNYPSQHYDSYIFGSSRACGINSYHWKKYLPEGANQYVFQSWSETLSGIDQKVTYLDEHGVQINNALVLIDIPGSFKTNQYPKEALTIKDYKFSRQPQWAFQGRLFYNYIQKPSVWIKSISKRLSKESPEIVFDTVSNDWSKDNRNRDVCMAPDRDSLNNCSEMARDAFLSQFHNSSAQLVSGELINADLEAKLKHVAMVFESQKTDYHILVTPAPCYTNDAINPKDLQKLIEIFGITRVRDFSGVNELTSDCYNFSDPNHFGLNVGWKMIEEIYGSTDSDTLKIQ